MSFVGVKGHRGGAIRFQWGSAALLAGSAALTTFLGFHAGGFFPDSTALAVVGVAVILILRVGLARDPFGGLTRRSALAIASLALFAVWTLGSASWSDAPGRAVLEFDRALLPTAEGRVYRGLRKLRDIFA